MQRAADIIQLDSRRPRFSELLRCLFCFTEHVGERVKGVRYSDCPGCDEQASVHRRDPAWPCRIVTRVYK